VKFTEHGSVRLHVGIARQDEHGALVRFEVQDTGPGIAVAHQAHLFKAFEQADTTATRTHGGTGLGLALTRQLAALMGGEAGVRSLPGRGSTFWFTAELASASEAGEEAVPIPTQALRALLVDGFVESSTAFSQQLRALGVQLHIEPDAAAAQAWAEAEFALGRVADLVFIDSRAGAPDGGDTVARLRAALGAGMPPSILLAHPGHAHGTLCDAEIAWPAGASALHDTIMRVVRHQGDFLGATPPPGEAEALVKLRHAGQRVLLAEDNPVNRDVASELIRSAGLLIETAPDGAQAVELALSRRYDLILMDIQMPVMDGLQATRLIRAKAGRGVPVIALTANAFVDDRAACIEAGMNDHVCKPVDPEALYAALLRWLPLVDRNLAQAPAAAKPAVPGAPALRSLRERLGGVEGFAVTTALRNVGGKMETVARVLARFSDSYRAGVPEFEDVGADSDRQAIRQACHSLRGACAAIGAKVIETELQVFEDALDHDGNAGSWGDAATALNQHVTRLVGALELELQR
jgi:two-component system, sensor histidine kinase and response regulator